MAKGIDIYSRYQKVTSWQAVKDDGVEFVYVKLSDGGGLPNGGRNPGDGFVAGAKSVGIPVGGYHYAQFSPTAEAQADFFAGVVRNLGATDLVPMLDLEAPFEPNDRAKDFGIKFCRRILDKGFRPGVYMSSSFAKTLRPDQWGIPGLVIWIASYGRNDGQRHALTGGYTGRFDIHQFTSAGQIRGIVGQVDVNESENDSLFDKGDELVATEKEIEKIAFLTVNELMSRGIGTGEPEGKPFLPFSTHIRYTQFDAAKAAAGIQVLLGRTAGASAEEIASKLSELLAPQLVAVLREANEQIPDFEITEEQMQKLAEVSARVFGERLLPRVPGEETPENQE